MDKREILIDYYKSHFYDLIPFDDPQYSEKLQRNAEAYADWEINGPSPEEQAMIEAHDKWLEENGEDIDFQGDSESPDDFGRTDLSDRLAKL